MAAVFLRRMVILVFFLAGVGFGGGKVGADDSSETVFSESLTAKMSFLLVPFCFCVASCCTLISLLTSINSETKTLGLRATTFSASIMVVAVPSLSSMKLNYASLRSLLTWTFSLVNMSKFLALIKTALAKMSTKAWNYILATSYSKIEAKFPLKKRNILVRQPCLP